MTTSQMLQQVFIKLQKSKFVIFISGLILALLLFLWAFTSKSVYTAKASVFPLTNQQENTLTNGSLTALLGIAENSKSFTGDAAIDIIELATSRNLRETVAATRLTQFENKTVAELLIQNQNKNLRFYSKKLNVPSDSISLVIKGAELLRTKFEAKLNKNGVLELYYGCTDPSLVTPVSETIIAKISEFYINLRTQKAYSDYSFIVKKIDSLDRIIAGFDHKAIQLQNETFFTPEKLEYTIPKENLAMSKERLIKQREASIYNRDEALWRLQKVTPIIATLDKPTPPFQIEKRSTVIWPMIGFIFGALLAVIFVLRNILSIYLRSEVRKAVFGEQAS